MNGKRIDLRINKDWRLNTKMMKTLESVSPSLSIETIQSLLRNHPIQFAILFGSHAQGTITGRSDVDIAVDFTDITPTDSTYNDIFFEVSAELSEALSRDDIDLVDLQTATPQVASAIYSTGILIMGDEDTAEDRFQELTVDNGDARSPRERLDGAVARINGYFETSESGIPATGNSEDDR